MTLSSPAARVSRVVTFAVAAVVGVLAAVPTAANANAVAAGILPAELPLTLAMSPGNDGVLRSNASLTVALSVSNPNSWSVGSGEVGIQISPTALSTDADVAAWLAEPEALQTPLGVASVPSIAAGDSVSTSTTIDASELDEFAPGVYPISATYDSDQGTLVAGSVVVVPDDESRPDVAVVVPIAGPALTAGLLTSNQLATLTAPDGSLRAQLDAVSGTDAILAVDPAIVAAIRVLGTAAPADAQQWLTDLLALPNSRFALQFGDADVATQIDAGLSDLLATPTLDPYVSTDDFTIPSATPPADAVPDAAPDATPGAGASADPQPTSEAPEEEALPTTEQLLDIGHADAEVFWPQTGTAGADLVAALAGLGDAVTLVASTALTDADAPTDAHADADGAELLVYDAEVSAALNTASSSTGEVTRSAALAAASAYTSLAATDADTVLVTLDRADDRSSDALRDAIEASGALGSAAAPGLAQLRDGSATSVTLGDPEITDPARSAALSSLLRDESDLDEFSSILTDPTVLTAPERATILQLIGAAWDDGSTAFSDAIEAHRADTAATLDAVALVPPSDITLAATSAPLSFTVRNDLQWPVSLVLVTTPTDARLQVQGSTSVEAGAAQNTRVQVPVEARVASGESTLRLQLRSPTSVEIGQTVRVEVAVRAEWESVGLVVLIVLVGGMIVLGIVRTVLRLRREKTDEPDPEEADDPEGPAEADEEGSDG
ncbi:MAG: DUF6049 family protein [Microbacterium sp.]